MKYTNPPLKIRNLLSNLSNEFDVLLHIVWFAKLCNIKFSLSIYMKLISLSLKGIYEKNFIKDKGLVE